MTQQMVTIVVAVVLVAAIGLSYLRTRGDSDDGSCDRMKSTLDEFEEYFGTGSRRSRGRMSQALDLVPLEMLSEQLAGREPKRRGERGKRQR